MNQTLLQKLDEKRNALDALRPFPKEILKGLNKRFQNELTYNSNAIEGNTLTLKETILVLEKGITVEGKPLKDYLEVKNHKAALDFLETLTHKKSFEIQEADVLNIQKIILQGIDDDNAGIYRSVSVRILGSQAVFPNPLKIPELMEEFFSWLQTKCDIHTVQLAADAHYKLVTVHPFVDGNGRTARLLMNLILIQNGFPPANILMENRREYIDSLEKAHLENNLEDFYDIIIKAVDKSLDIYLEAIKKNIRYD